MSDRLSNADLAQLTARYNDGSVTEQDRSYVLKELLRTRPRWNSVDLEQHMSSRYYQVAGTTPGAPDPVWIGRAKYDPEWMVWVDANTAKPFTKGTQVTHYLQELTPPEIIGQPER